MIEMKAVGSAPVLALKATAALRRDASASGKSKGLARAFHFSLRFNTPPACRTLQKYSALPSRIKCHVLPTCHFFSMTALHISAKQNHNQPLRQRPRKGQKGSGADRQVSQSGKPLLRRSLRSLNLPAGRCPLGSPGMGFHPCTLNTQKRLQSDGRPTGPFISGSAVSAKGLLALCTPRQRRCPCIPPKGIHPFGIPVAPPQKFSADPAESFFSPEQLKSLSRFRL